MSQTTRDAVSCPEICFEESLSELEQVATQLEEGKLSLDEALTAYEIGVKHLKQCHQALYQAERRIELLSGFDAAGNPIVQPFDDTATASEAENNVAKRSRTSKPKKVVEPEEVRDLF